MAAAIERKPFQIRWNDLCDSEYLEAWSNITDKNLQNNVLCLDSNSSDQVSEKANQMKIDFPTEVLEIIASYFDGKTLLNFKLVSKKCKDIVSYVERCYKPWKKICYKEIPKPYFIDLIGKHFFDNLKLDFGYSDKQYEMIYKLWLQWQGTVFSVRYLGSSNFLNHDINCRMFCQQFQTFIFLPTLVRCILFMKVPIGEKYIIIKTNIWENASNSNPLILNTSNHKHVHVALSSIKANVNLDSISDQIRKRIKIMSKNICNSNFVLFADKNPLVDVECFVIESGFLCSYDTTEYDIPEQVSCHLKNTMFVSVVHGVIIGRTSFNNVVIHNIYKSFCFHKNSWLEPKYLSATAVYIYTNVLLVGTQNSYLIAYRLKCWDDLVNLKKKNMLFEIQLDTGPITNINLLNYKNDKIVVVLSQSKLNWIKIN